MRFSENFIEEVVARTDIEEVIGRYVTLKRAGSNLVGRCPFHSEKTPSFSVSPTKKMFYCFGCQAGGSVITFIQKTENLSYPEAIEYLANRAGLPIPQDSQADIKQGVSRKRVLEANLEAAKFFRACLFDERIGRAGMRYFREERKLTEATVKHFGLGFAPDSFNLLTDHMRKLGYTEEELVAAYLSGRSAKTGRLYDLFRNRVMFPIIDPSGNVVAFGGRVMDDSKPKYLNSADTPAFKKSRHLFALNFAKGHAAERMILCEGYMDVIALHAAGFENAVATLGTAITAEHARVFSKYTKKVIITYDSDTAGQNAANKAMRMLGEVGMEVRVLKLSGAKDPDEFIKKFGAERFRQALDQSKTGFEHKLEFILSKYDLTTPSDKLRASGEVCSLIAEYPSPVEREIYLYGAGERLGLPPDVLKASVEQLRRKQSREESARRSREAQTSVKNFGDRINPDAAKDPRAVSAEETVLGLLCMFEEYRSLVDRGEVKLTPDDFFTAFDRRVFEEMMTLHRSEHGFKFELMGEKFEPDEMGRIRRMEMSRADLSRNGVDVFRSAVEVLHDIASQKRAGEGDLAAQIAFLRQKKEKLHKGKADKA